MPHIWGPAPCPGSPAWWRGSYQRRCSRSCHRGRWSRWPCPAHSPRPPRNNNPTHWSPRRQTSASIYLSLSVLGVSVNSLSWPVAASEPLALDLTEAVHRDPVPEVTNDGAVGGETRGGLVVMVSGHQRSVATSALSLAHRHIGSACPMQVSNVSPSVETATWFWASLWL